MTENILTQLNPSPPDVETLRIYLTLPLYHEFRNPKQHIKLQKPFVKALLGLKQPASKVVGSWYSTTSCDYFERLINVFKTVAVYILSNQKIPEGQVSLKGYLLHIFCFMSYTNKVQFTFLYILLLKI